MSADKLRVFRTHRDVEFADTDLAGIVHFSRFFVFMETAEHQLLASLGHPVSLVRDGVELGWPRVAARCEYLAPARFGDRLEIAIEVRRRGRTSMTYAFRFEREGEAIARGEMTSVCCEVRRDGMRPIELPAAIADAVEETPC